MMGISVKVEYMNGDCNDKMRERMSAQVGGGELALPTRKESLSFGFDGAGVGMEESGADIGGLVASGEGIAGIELTLIVRNGAAGAAGGGGGGIIVEAEGLVAGPDGGGDIAPPTTGRVGDEALAAAPGLNSAQRGQLRLVSAGVNKGNGEYLILIGETAMRYYVETYSCGQSHRSVHIFAGNRANSHQKRAFPQL